MAAVNVLYLINHAGKGGAERYVHTLATRLDITAFFAYNEKGLLAERMAGIPTFQIMLGNRFDLRAAKRIADFCREHAIDVIHTHFLRENYIALLSRLFYPKTRVVYTSHIIMGNDMLTRLSNRVLSRLQHAVIAVCNTGKAQLIKNGIPPQLITVVHNGAEPNARQASVHDIPVFIYAARFAEGKGHKWLINAAATLPKETPFKLVLAGEGPLLEAAKSEAQRLKVDDRVEFLGFRDDIPELLAGSDICVCASESEALSMSILEAMAAGLPVIATNVGGNPELVNERTGCGVLVEYGDTQGLADAMRNMLDNPDLRKKCGQAALKAASGAFSVGVMLDKTMAVYTLTP